MAQKNVRSAKHELGPNVHFTRPNYCTLLTVHYSLDTCVQLQLSMTSGDVLARRPPSFPPPDPQWAFMDKLDMAFMGIQP